MQVTRISQELNEYRTKLGFSEQENVELRRRLDELADLNDKLVDYENRMNFLTKEIERLNVVLKSKVDGAANLQRIV